MRLILASQSPRRREILSYFSLPFEQIPSAFDEESLPFRGDAQQYVIDLASAKAQSVAQKFPDAIVIGADTIVYKEGKIYPKPKDEREALQGLSELAGNWHSVFTGVALIHAQKKYQSCEETRVLFRRLTAEQIRRYHHCIPYADKAGGYAIQSSGGLIAQRIEGCYFNVLGLPINTLHDLLHNVGIDLWDHLSD
jgi:septum formation protein